MAGQQPKMLMERYIADPLAEVFRRRRDNQKVTQVHGNFKLDTVWRNLVSWDKTI